MEQKKYKKGEVIFRQGDAGDSMFDIYWGRVGVYSGYGTKQEKLLTVLESGDFLGEMGMIDHAPRSATAVALENGTKVTEITEEGLGELFRESPAKVIMIMQQLSARLRKLTNDYMEACKTASGLVKVEEHEDFISETDGTRTHTSDSPVVSHVSTSCARRVSPSDATKEMSAPPSAQSA